MDKYGNEIENIDYAARLAAIREIRKERIEAKKNKSNKNT